MYSDSDLTDLSSELSSVRSSPSPPPTFGYPSPQSSQENSANSASISGSQQGSRKRSLSPHDLPPKKRKRVEAPPRTTVHLDLRSPLLQPTIDQAAQLNLLLKTLHKRRKIVVIAGAGISTSAGGEHASLYVLLAKSLTFGESLISAHPMAFSIPSKAKIGSRLRASTSSMLLSTRPMILRHLSMRWSVRCQSLSTTPNLQHSTKCWLPLQVKVDFSGSIRKTWME